MRIWQSERMRSKKFWSIPKNSMEAKSKRSTNTSDSLSNLWNWKRTNVTTTFSMNERMLKNRLEQQLRISTTWDRSWDTSSKTLKKALMQFMRSTSQPTDLWSRTTRKNWYHSNKLPHTWFFNRSNSGKSSLRAFLSQSTPFHRPSSRIVLEAQANSHQTCLLYSMIETPSATRIH